MNIQQTNRGRKPKEKRYNSEFAIVLRNLLFTKECEGLSLTAVADELGITRQSLAQYRDGNNIPDIVILGRMADYFNVTADYLLGRTQAKTAEINERAAVELTGLSDEAIETLKKIRQDEQTGLRGSDIVSNFISHPIFISLVAQTLQTIDTCNTDEDATRTLNPYDFSTSVLLPKDYAIKINAETTSNIARIVIDNLIYSHTGEHTLIPDPEKTTKINEYINSGKKIEIKTQINGNEIKNIKK